MSGSFRRAMRALGCALLFLLPGTGARSNEPGKVRILLLGDSTTIGSICRAVDPAGPHLEQVLAQALEAETGRPAADFEALNQGRDGETIEGLLSSGRYAKEIRPLGKLDYVFIRYGINDSVRRADFAANFPLDYHELIARLRQDFPGATLVPTFIIPYLGVEKDTQINGLIKQVAELEKLPLFDVHAPYQAILEQGKNALNYRRYALDKIPANQRALAAPFVTGGEVRVMDNRLDPHFGNLPGWYDDRHPNLAGYHAIAAATAKFLAPLINK